MIPNPVYDFKVKVRDLEFLYCNFLQFQCFLKAFNGFYSFMVYDRALSKILRSTIPIPVHGLKVKVADFEFFVFSFYSVSFSTKPLIVLNQVWHE